MVWCDQFAVFILDFINQSPYASFFLFVCHSFVLPSYVMTVTTHIMKLILTPVGSPGNPPTHLVWNCNVKFLIQPFLYILNPFLFSLNFSRFESHAHKRKQTCLHKIISHKKENSVEGVFVLFLLYAFFLLSSWFVYSDAEDGCLTQSSSCSVSLMTGNRLMKLGGIFWMMYCLCEKLKLGNECTFQSAWFCWNTSVQSLPIFCLWVS